MTMLNEFNNTIFMGVLCPVHKIFYREDYGKNVTSKSIEYLFEIYCILLDSFSHERLTFFVRQLRLAHFLIFKKNFVNMVHKIKNALIYTFFQVESSAYGGAFCIEKRVPERNAFLELVIRLERTTCALRMRCTTDCATQAIINIKNYTILKIFCQGKSGTSITLLWLNFFKSS